MRYISHENKTYVALIIFSIFSLLLFTNLTTHSFLTNAPVTNTPLKRTNTTPNAVSFSSPASDSSVSDWVFGTNGNNSHVNTVENGNHNLPDNLLSPTAIVEDNLV